MIRLLTIFNFFYLVSSQPNVLMIIADDMATYPFNDLNLPNFDFLKSHSYNFQNAFVQYPVCGPSRASIFTGKYPDSIKNYNFYHYVNNQLTIPKFFKSLNYESISIGKTFHQPSPLYKDHWTYPFLIFDSKANNECPKNAAYCKINPKKLADYKIITEAISMINKLNKPFFMAIGLRRPHLSLANPTLKFPSFEIKLPNNSLIVDQTNLNYYGCFDDLSKNKIWFGKSLQSIINSKRLPIELSASQPPIYRFLKEYYISYQWIDNQLGRLFNFLKNNQQWNNTMIIFLSDHGWNFGHHGFWCKNSLIDSATRIPLIIKPPFFIRPIYYNHLVQAIDIFPTILELINQKTFKLDGISLFKNNSYVFSQYPRCKIKGMIQDHPCTAGSCQSLPEIKWMGYSVRELINSDLYMFTGWWPFQEKRSCVNGIPITYNQEVDWSKNPTDILLLKNGSPFISNTLIKKYSQVIINKFKWIL